MMHSKIVINPAYEGISDYLRSIPERKEELGRVIYAGRNRLFHTVEHGIDLSIKSFKVPIFLNRIIYAWFRKSKARRSYEHALMLTQLGISTPEPVAYIETFRNGLLHRSYYVCLMLTDVHDVRQWELRDDRVEIETGIAKLMAKLHAAKVYHRDFSPGNVLFDSNYKFYLVDINRMTVGNIPQSTLLKNFDSINEDIPSVRRLALRYADETHIEDREQFADKIAASAEQWWKRRNRHYQNKSRRKQLTELLKRFSRH